MTNLVDKVATGEVNKEEMTAHASTLMWGYIFVTRRM